MDEVTTEKKNKVRPIILPSLAGATFACVLTVLGANLNAPHTHKAVALMCCGIIVLVAFLVIDIEREDYHVSILMKVISLLGVVSCLLGIDLLLYDYDHAIGGMCAILSIGMCAVLERAETRAKRRKKKAEMLKTKVLSA